MLTKTKVNDLYRENDNFDPTEAYGQRITIFVYSVSLLEIEVISVVNEMKMNQ